jgi:hypothetical protein
MDRQGLHCLWPKRDGAYLHRSTLLLELASVHSEFLMGGWMKYVFTMQVRFQV